MAAKRWQLDRVWLVLSHSGFSDVPYSKEQILEMLAKSFELTVVKQYHGVKLYLFGRRAIPTSAEMR